jgi:hypothetical protein
MAFNAGLGAMYGPLFLHMLHSSVHRSFVNGFKVTINLKVSVLVGSWNLNSRVIKGLTRVMQFVCSFLRLVIYCLLASQLLVWLLSSDFESFHTGSGASPPHLLSSWDLRPCRRG